MQLINIEMSWARHRFQYCFFWSEAWTLDKHFLTTTLYICLIITRDSSHTEEHQKTPSRFSHVEKVCSWSVLHFDATTLPPPWTFLMCMCMLSLRLNVLVQMWQTNTLGTAACIVRRWRDRLAFSVNSARHWLHLKRPLRTFRAREALRSAGRVAMSGTERRAARSLVLHWQTCQFWPGWYWPITALNVTGKIMGTKEERKKRIQNLVLVLVCSSPMSTVCLLVLNIAMLCTQLCKGFRWNAASPPSTQPQHTQN